MSETVEALRDPYLVRPGDTLSSIARRCGKSVSDLHRWNGISNPNKLEIGQSLCLSESSAFGVSALFLDALRHPLANLPFMLKFDGRTVTGRTGADGLVPRQVTRSAQSEVQVWVKNIEGVWQQVAQAASGYGHKLLTLVSNAVVVPGKTHELPKGVAPKPSAPAVKPQASSGAQPPLPKPATGAPAKNNPAVKTRKAKGPQGQPVLKIEVEIPQGLLDLFANFQGGDITEKQWSEAAVSIESDVAVLKAFAEVESGGRSSFWRLNKTDGASIPALLFERHYFSRLTGGKYDDKYPDISWPTGYRKKSRLGSEDKKMQSGKVLDSDVYSDYASAYLRLINAYRLDSDAALKSCSWGKFQIMGENFELCDARSVKAFVAEVCKAELFQIRLVCQFIRNKPAVWKDRANKKLGKHVSLWEAVKAKDWPMIAFNYNGSGYKEFAYDKKLQAAYEKHVASRA